MNKIFIVWERKSFAEYDVILITEDEEKAKELSGQNTPGTYSDSTNGVYWYEERIMEEESEANF